MNSRAAKVFARPETELIACCARKDLDSRSLTRIQQLLQQGQLDWSVALRRAHWHGLLPFVYTHLSAAAPDAMPPLVHAELKKMSLGNARRNLTLTAELLKLLREFSSAGIPVISFKGPLIAQSLYENLALRQFVDLDLLIRREDILKARKVLLDRGLRPQFELTEKQELIYFNFRSEHAFANPDKTLIIDLHCSLTPRYFSSSLDLDRYWNRLQPVRLGDTSVHTFSRQDLLLLLCIHGAKDMWDRLIWIADIAQLLRVGGQLDWPAISREAEEVGGTRMLHHGLLLTNEVLGVELPPEVAPAALADARARWLANQAANKFLEDNDDPPPYLERLHFYYKSIARPGSGFKYVCDQVFTPTPLEWQQFPLPENYSFLYRVARPLRLAIKHLRRLLWHDPITLSAFEPTPDEVINRMLELAEVISSDVLYDLGSGDGRIPIAAAQRFGVRATGFEIDPNLRQQARSSARKSGVQRLVKFRDESVLRAGLSNASVVTMYLPWAATLRLRPKLLRELKPGTRIVSREEGLADWVPERVEQVETPSGKKTTLYLWRIAP
jgi:putative nucleotidyltransferase-like protein